MKKTVAEMTLNEVISRTDQPPDHASTPAASRDFSQHLSSVTTTQQLANIANIP